MTSPSTRMMNLYTVHVILLEYWLHFRVQPDSVSVGVPNICSRDAIRGRSLLCEAREHNELLDITLAAMENVGFL